MKKKVMIIGCVLLALILSTAIYRKHVESNIIFHSFNEPVNIKVGTKLEKKKERERHGGSQSPKKPGRETSSRNWSEKLAPSFIVQKAFYTFDKTRRSMGNTKLCSFCSPDSFYTSFCIQKVSGDLHYLLAKRLVKHFLALFLNEC